MSGNCHTPPSLWLTVKIEQITLPISTTDPVRKPESQFTYLDISGIDNSTNKIASVKSYLGKDAPSRARQVVKANDILFSTVRTYLKNIAKVPERYDNQVASTGFCVLRPASGVNPDFLFYQTLTPSFLNPLDNLQRGSSYPAVRDKDVREQIVVLPPLAEQRRIVAKIEELFSELDKGIESLRTTREQIKVYRQALLKHAFEGKLTEQWRGDNKALLETAEDLLQRIKTERAQHYQQQLDEWEAAGKQGSKPKAPKELKLLTVDELGELPELPKGWGWVKYGDICSIVRNGISEKPEGQSGTPIFRISAVRPMSFDLHDYRYIDNTTGRYDGHILKRGDLIFTRYNGSRHYVGVCAEYRSDEKRLFPDKLVQTRIFSERLHSSYFEKALNCGFSRKFLETKIRTTAGQSGVSGDDIKNTPVPICSTHEQAQIVTLLESKLSTIEQLDHIITASLQQAEAMRQSILQKAFSGQLVPQDPNDEPASALLERIKAEKAGPPAAVQSTLFGNNQL